MGRGKGHELRGVKGTEEPPLFSGQGTSERGVM